MLVYAHVYVLTELQDATWKLVYTCEMTFDMPELDCTEVSLCGWLAVKIQFQTNLMPVSLSQSHHLCSLCAISILCVVSLRVNFSRVSLELGLLASEDSGWEKLFSLGESVPSVEKRAIPKAALAFSVHTLAMGSFWKYLTWQNFLIINLVKFHLSCQISQASFKIQDYA